MTEALQTYSEERRKKELLNRLRARVTKRQAAILQRTNKKLGNCRFVNDDCHVIIGDIDYRIKVSDLNTRLDPETRRC